MSSPEAMEEDTIVAVATPPGRGGIGIVRISGVRALSIAQNLTGLHREPASHRAHYTHVLDEAGVRIDDALLTWFQSPRSYTGEDVVEIATHGAPVILQTVVERALQYGARLARAGEFTERAFLNRRLDLTQAEAVRDLIDAQTLTQARLAAEQMGGSLARMIRPIKQALVELIATLEAGIDFAEDDLETLPTGEIHNRIAGLLPPLEALLQSYARGRLVREGLRIALIGKPNAGKSSLFNRLLERERSIVTAVAGTTRDVVSEYTAIQGIPVELLDTAGLRETKDEIERIGVARSHEAAAEADLVLHILDAREDASAYPPGLIFSSLQSSLSGVPMMASTQVQAPAFPMAASAEEPIPDSAKRSRSSSAAKSVLDSADRLVPDSADESMLGSAAKSMPGSAAKSVLGSADRLGPDSADESMLGSAAAQELDSDDNAGAWRGTTPAIVVHNKADLLPTGERQRQRGAGHRLTSALTGEGIGDLRQMILEHAGASLPTSGAATLSNLRQRDTIARGLAALRKTQNALAASIPHEMLLLDLYEALGSLDELTGETTPDSILNLIFSTFCIGK